MRSVMTALFLILGFCLMIAQAYGLVEESGTHFGKITIQMGANEEQNFWITNALLYENASIDFDTTVQVQDEKGLITYYYPQILEGKNNILRLILEPQDNGGGNFYDVTFDLGDSLLEKVIFEKDSAKAYFNQNGQLIGFRQESKNLNGSFLIITDRKENQLISGELDISFDLPQNEQATEFSRISMTGNFEVPTGEFREVSLSASAPIKKREGKYKQNIIIAIALTAIAIIAFGLR